MKRKKALQENATVALHEKNKTVSFRCMVIKSGQDQLKTVKPLKDKLDHRSAVEMQLAGDAFAPLDDLGELPPCQPSDLCRLRLS